MTAPKIMAKLETANFEFYAFASSKTEALKMLEEKWNEHARRTGATYTFKFLRDGVFFSGIQAGAFERSELPEPPRVRKTRVRGYTHLIPID
jgi:hypothetical protein